MIHADARQEPSGEASRLRSRARSAPDGADADALVWHAIIINTALGLFFSALVLGFGPSLYLCWAAGAPRWCGAQLFERRLRGLPVVA
jgi:hypothetical protein